MLKGDLKEVLRLHGLWLSNEPEGVKADLEGADLILADLRRADLRLANLRRANLEGADLRRANLEGADLRRVNLRRADLEGADLEGADLRRANLEGANLEGADLRRANLRRANLEGADLEGANLDFSSWDLSCKTLKVITDERLRVQLAFHWASLVVYNENATEQEKGFVIQMKDYLNKFHRVDVNKL